MKVKFTTNIDKELLQEIKIKALKENKNVNEIIEILFKKYSKEEGKMKFIEFDNLDNLKEIESIEVGLGRLTIRGSNEELQWEMEFFPEEGSYRGRHKGFCKGCIWTEWTDGYGYI